MYETGLVYGVTTMIFWSRLQQPSGIKEVSFCARLSLVDHCMQKLGLSGQDLDGWVNFE